jgi:hypothetical protein
LNLRKPRESWFSHFNRKKITELMQLTLMWAYSSGFFMQFISRTVFSLEKLLCGTSWFEFKTGSVAMVRSSLMLYVPLGPSSCGIGAGRKRVYHPPPHRQKIHVLTAQTSHFAWRGNEKTWLVLAAALLARFAW